MNISLEQKKAAMDRVLNKCEMCGAQHLAFGWRKRSGAFMPVHSTELTNKKAEGYRIVRIFLDVFLKDSIGINLICLCKRCQILFQEEKDNAPKPVQQKLL